jgi:hypothetical protein
VTEWITARVLADAKVPGLPGTRFRIRDHAKRHGWKHREVPGAGLRGGARVEYHISNLSEVQRASLVQFLAIGHKSLPAAAVDGATISGVADAGATPADDIGGAAGAIEPAMAVEATQMASGTLDEPEVRRRWRWRQFEAKSAARQKDACRRATAAAKAIAFIKSGHPKMSAYELAAKEHSFSATAVRGFAARVDGFDSADFAAVLIDERHGRPREASYSSRIDDLFRADYLRLERPSATSCYDRISPIAEREGLELPSLATIKRHLKRDMTRQSIVAAREGRKALEATLLSEERATVPFSAPCRRFARTAMYLFRTCDGPTA